MWFAAPKTKEDLGFKTLEVKKRALLGKWIFKRLAEKGGVANHPWEKARCLTSIVSGYLEILCRTLMGWSYGDEIFFFPHGSFSIRDGSEIRFRGINRSEKNYLALYNIVCHKGDTIAKLMKTSPPNVSFGRSIIGPRQTSWNFSGNLNESGKFLVDYMYTALIQPMVPVDSNEKIWKMKIKLKTKVFAWYLGQGVILTKDNLA
jgi:hypothetical protein